MTTIDDRDYIEPTDEEFERYMASRSDVPAPPPALPRRSVPQPKQATVTGFEWTRATHMRDAVEPMMARYRLAAEFPGAIHEPTGIAELDEIVPVAPGRMIVVAGRQGAGKSALSLQISRYVASRGPVLYLLTEMSLAQVVTRIVANTAHIDTWKLDRGAHADTLAAAEQALCWLRDNADLAFVEVAKAKLSQLLESIRNWHAANPEARMVVVDNLWGVCMSAGIASGDGAGMSVRMGMVAKAFADLSVELGLPVILVHHENRTGAPSAKGEPSTPDASQLGGSDHIGNWASSVIQLRKRPQVDAILNGGLVGDPTHDAYITKNRDGRADVKIGLRFVGSEMRFEGKTAATPFETAPAVTDTDRRYRAALAELPPW